MSPCSRILIISFLLLLPATGWAATLPDMGSSSGKLMTLEEERQLGREFMRQVRQQLPILDDPVITRYVQALGDDLSSRLDQIDYQFQFFVIDDPTINAFAGPGGHIGIHSGLILAAKNEDELASVISHEIAHISQRHLLRRFEKQSNMALTTMAALVAAILLGQSNNDVGQAIFTSTIAGTTQSQLNFSRVHEKEADNVGIRLMYAAGYQPGYMASFFETLLAKRRADIPEFILTHPLTTSRIADAKNRAMQFNQQIPTINDPVRFGLIQARLALPPQVYDSQQANKRPIIHFEPNSRITKRYWKVLQLIHENKPIPAKTALMSLIKIDQSRIIYSITQAEIAIKAKNSALALEILAKALLNHPNNQAITALYAKTLLLNNKSQTAYIIIRQHIDNGNQNAELYRMLANSAKKLGKLGEAYESLAKYHYKLGQNTLALEHLETAIKLNKGQQHRLLRLNTRIKQIQQEILANRPKPEPKSNYTAIFQ